MLAGYSKKKRNRAIFFVMGLLAGFVSGFCIKTINPVPDILNAHAEGVIYGLYASQDEKEKILALTAAKAWKEISEEKEVVNVIYKRAQKRIEPFHLAVVLEALESLNLESSSVK